MSTKVTRELIDKQLGVKGFSSNSAAPKRLSDPTQETPMFINLDQLRPYNHNPRKTRNPLYEEIKDSIRFRGLDQAPVITRRPGEEFFIIRSGGNTRLEILNELWQETQDERFYKINCLFKPWQSEINALAGHLAENELHGQMSFIDKARGVANIKGMYEEELGEALSLRKLSAQLKSDGYPISHGLLSHMLKCVSSILPAIPTTLLEGLGRPQVARLIQLKNNLAKVWQKHDDSDSSFREFWIMVLSAHDTGVSNFNYVVIQDEMIGQMSAMLGKSYNSLELDLAAAESGIVNKNPLSAEQLAIIANSPPPTQQSNAEKGQDDMGSPTTSATGDKKTEISSAAQKPQESSDQASDKQSNKETSQGDNLPVFGDAVLSPAPVTAGGPLASVTDVWHIETGINDIVNLRNNIWLLTKDICNAAGVDDFFQTNEGLGFGISKTQSANESPLARTVKITLISILRMSGTISKESPVPILDALFSQILIGSYDITVGNNKPEDIGLVRLPDAELVKLFRIIRLARVLVDAERDSASQP